LLLIIIYRNEKGGVMKLISSFALSILLCTNFSSKVNAVDSYANLLSHDNFFRALSFKRIEKVCFQLLDDLELFVLGPFPELLERSGYLLNQFCNLFTHVQELISNPDESRMFLPDDIAYLINLLVSLEQKLIDVGSQIESHQRQLLLCMEILLEQAKQKMEILIDNNIEVVFDPTKPELYLTQR